MIYLTSAGKLYAAVIFLLQGVSAIVGFAIALLVFLQLSRDPKGRSFGLLAGSVGLYGVAACVSDLAGYFDPSYNMLAATIASIALGLAAIRSIYFLMEYLELWTRHRRWVVWLNIFAFTLVPFAHWGQILFGRVAYSPDATYELEVLPVGSLILGSSVLVVIYTLGLLLWAYNRKRQEYYHTRFHAGLALLLLGGISFAIPPAMQLSLGSVLFSAGLLVLVQPVFHERLFDPLSQLNLRLAHRAEQFALIARVGHQAHSILTLNALLPNVARDICRAFDYAEVQVAVYNETGKCVEFGMSDTDGNLHSQSILNGDAHGAEDKCLPSLDIPFNVAGPENSLTGKIRVQSQHVSRFNADEQEVLQILARQIALAIRNAQLFEAVQQANDMKTNFISYASHELRNAVSNIVALSDNVLRHPEDHENEPLADVYQDDIRDILLSGRHLKRLLDDIVDLGQLESGKMKVVPRPIDPLPILQDVLQVTSSRVKEGIEVYTAFPATLPLIYADDTRLNQVLMNLLGNASKFTDQGWIRVDAHVEGSYLRFSVADTGTGIAPEAQSRLFEAYSQESLQVFRRYGGSGLGLGISKQLVELQGGRIWLESEAGKGSTFYFELPLVETS